MLRLRLGEVPEEVVAVWRCTGAGQQQRRRVSECGRARSCVEILPTRPGAGQGKRRRRLKHAFGSCEGKHVGWLRWFKGYRKQAAWRAREDLRQARDRLGEIDKTLLHSCCC